NNTATVTITVQEVNDIPTVAADSFTINEDQTLTVATTQLTANDTPGPQNESSQTLTLTSVNVVSLNGVPAPQSLTINSGSFTYTPPADFNGQVILQYTVTDNGTSRSVADPLANSGLITLTVNKINDPPVIGADTRVATEDLALQISASSLIDNDLVGPATATDEVLEGQVLAFAGIVTPAGQVGTVGTTTRGGTISYNSTTGIILYTPPTEYSGSGALADTFRYVVQDQIAGVPGAVATGTVTINVVEVNDPPQPVNDSITAVEDQNRQPIPPNVASTISATFLTVNDLPGPGNEAVQQTLRIVGFNSTTAPQLTATTAAGGTISVDVANQTLVYTPPADYFGTDSFTYVVEDDGLTGGVLAPQRGTAVVTITVSNVNDAPIPQNDHVNGQEDTSSTYAVTSLLQNDSPGVNEAQALSLTSVSTATAGASVVLTGPANNRQVVYTPPINFFGVDTFNYVVSDGSLASTGVVSVTVAEVNDAPQPGIDNLSQWFNPDTMAMETIEEDKAVSFAFTELTANDGRGAPNESSQTLTITNVAMAPSSASAGTVSIASGRVTFTPAANFFGTAVFTYVVRDNGTSLGLADPLTATGTVSLTVAAVNDPPTTVDDHFTTLEDRSLDILPTQMLQNDKAGPLNEQTSQTLRIVSAAALSPATHGSISVQPSGTVTFTPAQDFNGEFTFFYQVSDNGQPNLSNFGTVTITVTPVNDAPIANADSVNAVEDTPLTINTADLVANDLPGPASATDEAGQTLVIQAASYAGNNGSTLLVSPDGSTITYQAGPNFNGVETFTYTLWDGFGDPSNPQNLAVGVVTVTVAEANDPPVAIGDSRSTQEDVPVTITASLLTANDRPGPTNEPAATVHKEASQTMQVVGVGATSGRGGSVTFDSSTGLIVYTPPANFNNGSGVDTFTYIVEDNGTSSGTDSFQRATGTVTMTITPVNDNPIPVNDNVSTNEDTALTILEGDILANDAAGPADETGQALVITSVASASDNGGTITRAGATILYTPPANFNGIDRFTYVVQDNGTTNNLPDARSATGTIVVSIAPVNDPPFVANQPASVNATEDPTVTPIVVNLAGVFGDPDIALNNDTLTLTVNGNSRPSLVTAAITGTTLSLTPQLNQNGTAVISILATDSSGAGVTASINVNITAVNDDPVLANPIADFTVGEDAPNTTIELFPTVFDDPDVHTNNDQLTIRVLTNNNPSLVSATMSGTILTLDYAD
ncbi:MAG: tandem-95 repeat protein, partial [Planctomycetales bacterium]|nr:tandem-95 repeat protein [Planctomycetales bacterium]